MAWIGRIGQACPQPGCGEDHRLFSPNDETPYSTQTVYRYVCPFTEMDVVLIPTEAWDEVATQPEGSVLIEEVRGGSS